MSAVGVWQGPATTQQKTPEETASKGNVSSPTAAAASATSLPPVPTVPTASGFERYDHAAQDRSLLHLLSEALASMPAA